MISIQENVPLGSLTTFEIGGAARFFCDAENIEALKEAIAWAKERHIKFSILSGGSNLLVADAGVDHLVIRITLSGCHFTDAGVEVEAGKNLLALIRESSMKGLGGWEKLAGIPGTFGGAVRGNAGAFGSEIKDFITSVTALNASTGELVTYSVDSCEFAYRDSFFKRHSEWIVVSGICALATVEPQLSLQKAEDTIADREKRHLQNVRAAGSYFMNPVAPPEVVAQFEKEKGVKSKGGRVPAGWLIEKVGMKGERFGGAIASMMHPNYLVNEKSATAEEVLSLAAHIKQEVKKQFGIALQEEAQYLS